MKAKLTGLARYWRHYFEHVGLTAGQAKLAFEFHRKGSCPETAIYLAKGKQP